MENGVQVIDFDGNFNETLGEYLKSTGLSDKGFDFNLCSIFGCQSSGKSTLMNKLFGTEFQVMNAELGRSQTTKGVWGAKASGGSLFVMDLEGTDSRERGEECQNFERQAALFALALSEVVIVNMWAADLGRYNASNYGLLKTVFEVNLQLFLKDRSTKTMLYFVLRDHVKTPLNALQTMVAEDMTKIWGSISKPAGLEDSEFSDFFDFEFFALPHYELAREEFDNSIPKLQAKFYERSSNDCLFKPAYRRLIPSDGLSAYASAIWKTIQENKDLDLPTQREMLAVYRCDEIKEAAYAQFVGVYEDLKQRASGGEVIEGLGKEMGAVFASVTDTYCETAQRYDKTVFERKKAELQDRMGEEMEIVFESQLKNVYSRSTKLFDSLLSSLLPTDGTAARDFSKSCQTARAQAEEFFTSHASDSTVEGMKWSSAKMFEELTDAFIKRIDDERTTHLGRFHEEIKNSLRSKLKPLVQALMDEAKEDMWKRIRETLNTTTDKLSGTVQQRMGEFGCLKSETEETQARVKKSGYEIVVETANEVTKFIAMKMHGRFDEHFRYDEDQLPRKWTPDVDIRSLLKVAREKGMQMLELFSTIPIAADGSEAEDGEGAPLLDPAQKTDIRSRFERDTQVAFQEADAIQHRNNGGSVPPLFWLALVVFGFNEIWWFLTSPLLLFIFGPAFIAAGVCYYTGNTQLIAIGLRAAWSALIVAKEFAEEFLDNLLHPPQQAASTRETIPPSSPSTTSASSSSTTAKPRGSPASESRKDK